MGTLSCGESIFEKEGRQGLKGGLEEKRSTPADKVRRGEGKGLGLGLTLSPTCSATPVDDLPALWIVSADVVCTPYSSYLNCYVVAMPDQ